MMTTTMMLEVLAVVSVSVEHCSIVRMAVPSDRRRCCRSGCGVAAVALDATAAAS